MQGGGGEFVLPVLRVPDNAADAVSSEQIPIFPLLTIIRLRSKYNFRLKPGGETKFSLPQAQLLKSNFLSLYHYFLSLHPPMETASSTDRFYRASMCRKGLVRFQVRHLETDLHIQAENALSRECSSWIVEARRQIETYAASHRGFFESYSPLPPDPFAPPVVSDMLRASEVAQTGPMAAVAGAVAAHVGSNLVQATDGDVIVENGGDIFIYAQGSLTVSIWAGSSPLSGKVGIRLQGGAVPFGVCTSSGRVGHSRSFGTAHAVTVISQWVALADAAATGIGNMVKGPGDIALALESMQQIKGVSAGVIISGDKLGAWGDNIKLVPV